jgi:peptide/histidine transporter 3/4
MANSSFSTPLTSYLMSRYNMKPNAATNLNNIFSGMSSFAPVVGAFVADAFWGRFRTMLLGSVFGVIVSYYQAPCHSLSITRHLLTVDPTPMGK